MTACERQREMLGALVDGELSGAERVELEAHVAGCASCRQELEELQRLAAAFAALPEVRPAPDFEARFWARVARGEDAPQGLLARLLGWLSPGKGLVLAGAAAAALALYLSLPAEHADVGMVASKPTAAPAPVPEVVQVEVPAAPDTDVRIVANDRDFELLQEPEIDAISEL